MVDVKTMDNRLLLAYFLRKSWEAEQENTLTGNLLDSLQQLGDAHIEILRRMGEDVQKDADKQGTTVS